MEALELFHYIHKDHKKLVSRVDAVIREMIATGEMQDLINKTELQIMKKTSR